MLKQHSGGKGLIPEPAKSMEVINKAQVKGVLNEETLQSKHLQIW